jgi:hypothetical protein
VKEHLARHVPARAAPRQQTARSVCRKWIAPARLPRPGRDTIDVLHTTKAGNIGFRVTFFAVDSRRTEPHIGITSLEWLVRNTCPHALRDMPLQAISRDKKSKIRLKLRRKSEVGFPTHPTRARTRQP